MFHKKIVPIATQAKSGGVIMKKSKISIRFECLKGIGVKSPTMKWVDNVSFLGIVIKLSEKYNDYFLGFLSEKYLRQISILCNNE